MDQLGGLEGTFAIGTDPVHLRQVLLQVVRPLSLQIPAARLALHIDLVYGIEILMKIKLSLSCENIHCISGIGWEETLRKLSGNSMFKTELRNKATVATTAAGAASQQIKILIAPLAQIDPPT